jgi:hypothetical protein
MAIQQKEDFLSRPRILGLFEKQIDGDNALLELARLRFREAGLGMECHAETIPELEELLRLRPASDSPVTVHLSRSLNLFEEQARLLVRDFARFSRGRIYGLIFHDREEIAGRLDDYVAAARLLDSSLQKIEGSPYVFLEYASGLKPELFIKLLKSLKNSKMLSACIDTGHLGLQQVKESYSIRHPGSSPDAIKLDDAELPLAIGDIQHAVRSALASVLEVVRELGSLGKPLHFHLHDGHPLSMFSAYKICDHLSFLAEIPIPFEYEGRAALPLMFGPSGLAEIVSESLGLLGPELVSYTLEIHPTEGRIPLGNANSLFQHWRDKLNAERMNFWLFNLAQNRMLLSELCRRKIIPAGCH